MDELLAKGAIEPSTDRGGFFPAYLLLLSLLVASNPYSALRDFIAIYIYLLSQCLLSDSCGNLFNRLIVLFLLVSRMLIYIFLLLNITIAFYFLFGTNVISGRFCQFE